MPCSRSTIWRAVDVPGLKATVLRAAAAVIAAAGLAACSETTPPLPALGADVSQTSVSGLSSGAYMAGQFQFAHSGTVVGAGIVAGGPYGCAESVFGRMAPVWPVALAQNLNRAINGCTNTAMASLGVPDVGRLARRAADRARDGEIDSLDGLGDDRVYLFTGKADRNVAPSLVRSAADLYRALGVPAAGIALVDDIAAGHGFLTEEEGTRCSVTRSPFLNDCDYDQAGTILTHIYGPLKPPSAESRGEIALFSQIEFGGDNLDSAGAVFIPDSCRMAGGCRVHIAFHGCRQGRAEAGSAFIERAGYNRWAAANGVIVLYPQAVKSATNPRGCWDWWGYTGAKFLTRDAPQIKAVRAMLERLGQ